MNATLLKKKKENQENAKIITNENAKMVTNEKKEKDKTSHQRAKAPKNDTKCERPAVLPQSVVNAKMVTNKKKEKDKTSHQGAEAQSKENERNLVRKKNQENAKIITNKNVKIVTNEKTVEYAVVLRIVAYRERLLLLRQFM